MSTNPKSLSEVRALAEQSLSDPESSQHFLQALGVRPEAFAALDAQAQAQHLHKLAQQSMGVVKSGEHVAQIIPDRYQSKPLQLHQSVLPYGIFDRATGERIHTGKQSECTHMVKLLNQAFERGVSHAQSDMQKSDDLARELPDQKNTLDMALTYIEFPERVDVDQLAAQLQQLGAKHMAPPSASPTPSR